jgi:hypothetical protein
VKKVLNVVIKTVVCFAIIIGIFLFIGCARKTEAEIKQQYEPLTSFQSDDERFFWTQAYSAYMVRGGAAYLEQAAITADKMLLEYRKRK